MMHHLIWYGKLAEAHIKEGDEIHPNTRNNKTEILNQTANFYQQLEQDDDDDANGQTIRMKAEGSKYLNNRQLHHIHSKYLYIVKYVLNK